MIDTIKEVLEVSVDHQSNNNNNVVDRICDWIAGWQTPTPRGPNNLSLPGPNVLLFVGFGVRFREFFAIMQGPLRTFKST